MKDETRNTFSSFLDNLPQINSSKGKGSASPVPGGSAQVSKKVKRKASIPAPTAAPRMTQSVGPSVLNTDGSQDDLATAAKTNNAASVTKGTRTNKSSSQYPSYFFTPKENVFESKRGSKLDKSTGKPKAFHLT